MTSCMYSEGVIGARMGRHCPICGVTHSLSGVQVNPQRKGDTMNLLRRYETTFRALTEALTAVEATAPQGENIARLNALEAVQRDMKVLLEHVLKKDA